METARITVDDLGEVARDRALAEARELVMMVRFRDAQEARIAHLDLSLDRMVERSGIPVVMGQVMGLSAHQVSSKLAMADRVLEFAPKVWLAFTSGGIDYARLREISSAINRLERLESKQRLDDTVLAYATSHTVAELRQWLKRYVNRVEADLAAERAEVQREQRFVRVSHGEEGMSFLEAYLPSHQAAAITNRLHVEAKALGPSDNRRKAQREADLLVEWALNTPASPDGQPRGLRTDIAVTLDATHLSGLTDGFAESADGAWEVPAGWVLDSALAGEAYWHRLLVDPIIGDTLAHEYIGRFAPHVLRKAIAFRDGVCATPGCLTPADRCDIDHRTPWPEGPTTGSNLDPQCRRDHGLKGRRVLERLIHEHHARGRPTHRTRHRQPHTEHSRLEDTLAWALTDRTLT